MVFKEDPEAVERKVQAASKGKMLIFSGDFIVFEEMEEEVELKVKEVSQGNKPSFFLFYARHSHERGIRKKDEQGLTR